MFVRPYFILVITLSVLSSFVIWPQMDMAVSSWFYTVGQGFPAQQWWFLKTLNLIAVKGSIVLGAGLIVAALVAWRKHQNVFNLPAKAWLFLFVALIVGPGLIANGVFKDHWHRARPREITEFGGSKQFTPPLRITNQCDKNCSFVSGDGSFGFFLPTLAYVVPFTRRRRVFWSGMVVGSVFAAARILMGAHFLSDTLFAAFFMMLSGAGLHICFYGWRKTFEFWRTILCSSKKIRNRSGCCG